MIYDIRKNIVVEKGYKLKYTVGDILNDCNGNARYIVVDVYHTENKYGLYDLFDSFTNITYSKINVQRLQEIVNKDIKVSGKDKYIFLDKLMTLYEIEEILKYKKGSLVKYLKRKGYNSLETVGFIKEKETEYLESLK